MSERFIEFVFRVRTEVQDDSVLDSVIQHGAEDMFPDYTDEDPLAKETFLEYIPEGSYWKEVDRYDPHVQLYKARKEGVH